MSEILIVDDDRELCEMLSEYLGSDGFHITRANDGKTGLCEALTGNYDAIILDVMLPSMDGFEVLRDLRNRITTPVLMLTARGEDIDRIVGLEMGADDYLPKPFNPRELVARLKAILRRSEYALNREEVTRVGELELHPAAREILYRGEALTLTSCEYNILEILILNAGTRVDKSILSRQALGRKLTPYDRSIDMHVSKLRHKLGDDSRILIQTVRGLGYQLRK